MAIDKELITLTKLLEKSILALIDHISANDLTVGKVSYYTKVVEYWPIDGNSSKELEIRKPDNSKLYRSFQPLLKQNDSFTKLDECCIKLVDKYGSAPGTSGSPSATQLLFTYIQYSGLAKLNKRQIAIQVNKYLKALRSENISTRILVHIEGVASKKPFSLARGIKFRPITKRDIGSFGVDSRYSSQHTSSEWMHESAWLCLISIKSTKENAIETWSNSENLVASCITALRLANPVANLRYLMICKDNPDPYLGSLRTSSGSATPQSGRFYKVIDNNYDQAKIRLSRKLLKEILALGKYETQKCGNIHYALNKYSKALERQDRNDEIVDIATGLESLLCGDSKSEISYRFKIRGAAVLDKKFGDSSTRMALFSDIYAARSDVVHGNSRREKLKYRKTEKLPTEERVECLLPDARNAFSSILLWFLVSKESKSIRHRTSKHDSIFSFLDSKLADCDTI